MSNTPDRLAHVFKHYGIKQEDTPERVDMIHRVVGDTAGCRLSWAGYVYIIQNGETDIYKIGLTSGNPEDRLNQMQVGNPELLTLAHYIECKDMGKVEDGFHSHFARTHYRGEWYRIDTEGMEYIKNYKE